MTDGASSDMPGLAPESLHAGQGAAVPEPPPLPLQQPPRTGDLTTAWRVVTAVAWIAVAAGIAAVWNASVQLGLATWWLGPRSDPQPIVVRLLPFVPSVLMVLGTINRLRWLPIAGLVGAVLVGVTGLVDLGYVRGLGLTELVIAACAAAVSVASLTGTYRRADVGDPDR